MADLSRNDDPLLGHSMRLPPAALQAEAGLLGAILCNNKAFDGVVEFLHPHHFADPVHEQIYAAAARLINAGRVADPVTLIPEFQNSGVLDDVGGVAYLAELLNAMVGIINAVDYGRAILDAWLRRELINVCVETVNRAFAPVGVTGAALMEELDAGLLRVAEGAGDVKPLVAAGNAVSQALELSYAARERQSPLAGLTTGYSAIDRLTGGLMAGQLYLLGARPAMGKTGLGLGIAARAASAGARTLMWSGEMAANQLGTRLAAAHAGLEVASVFRGKKWAVPEDAAIAAKMPVPLDVQEWERLVRAEYDARKLPLQIDDRVGITVASLRARARRMKRSKAGLDLIVADYVGLMRASLQAQNRPLYERATEISNDLQHLAADLHVPVLVLAQLSRQTESRENKMPQLSDLRDTGALEQDAYCVMFIHRPHYYLVQGGEPVQGGKESAEAFNDRLDLYHAQLTGTRDQAQVSVAKNRNGPTGVTRLRFNAAEIWFRDEHEAGNSPAWGSDLLGGA